MSGVNAWSSGIGRACHPARFGRVANPPALAGHADIVGLAGALDEYPVAGRNHLRVGRARLGTYAAGDSTAA